MVKGRRWTALRFCWMSILVTVVFSPRIRADDNTILLLHFDEGSGAVAKDSSKSSFSGLITGAKWVEGKFGKALQFNGDDDFVDLGDNAAFSFGENTDFTVECWINVPTGIARGFYNIITKKLRGDATEPGFAILVDRAFCVRVGIADGFNFVGLASPKPVNDAQWHHIALTADRDGEAILYFDGVAEQKASMREIIDISNSYRNLRIGDRAHDGDFIGMIDEVRISKCVKTEFSLSKGY